MINDWETVGYTEEEWKGLSKSKRWRLRNPEKSKASTASWARRNPEQRAKTTRAYQLRTNYGITEERYQELLSLQDGKCAICSTTTPTGRWKVFAVDHNHDTNEVRGLLCNECNRGIGLLKDSPDLLRLAAIYIDTHNLEKNIE
jgi:hypothetical protein